MKDAEIPDRPAVLVAGAGPAGAVAAAVLARAGRQVLVIDRAAFPRDKSCGDAVSLRALETLEAAGIPAGCFGGFQTVPGMWLNGPYGGSSVMERLTPDGRHIKSAFVVPRTEFDTILLEHAVRSGASFRSGAAILKARWDGDKPELELDDRGRRRTVKPEILIGADGALSAVRRHLFGKPAHESVAIRGYFTGVKSPPASLGLFFPKELIPGYGWIFPAGGSRVNVGVGYFPPERPGRMTIQQAYRWFCGSYEPARLILNGAKPEGRLLGHPIPLAGKGTLLGRGRVLLVGDAASLASPTTGEGIYQAVESGRRAAEALLSSPEDPLPAYEQGLGDQPLDGVPMGRMVWKAASALPLLLEGAVRTLGLGAGVRRAVYRLVIRT